MPHCHSRPIPARRPGPSVKETPPQTNLMGARKFSDFFSCFLIQSNILKVEQCCAQLCPKSLKMAKKGEGQHIFLKNVWCQIVLVPNCTVPNCPGAKLSGCQIVHFYYLGAKLSAFIIFVPNCLLYYLGAKLSGAKSPVPNCPVPNCPTIKVRWGRGQENVENKC